MASGVKQEARCHQTCWPRTVFNRRCGDGVVCTSFVHTRHRTDLPSASKPPTCALYAISSESLSSQKFDYSAIAGSGDHSATLSLSAVKLICWQKNERPLAWNALRSYFAAPVTQNKFRHVLKDCKSYGVGSGSRSTSSAEQLFVKLSLSCRCGILRPLEVISFAFAIACSLKSEN